MKKQKLLFNESLWRYQRYIRKLARMQVSGRNAHRQNVLQKHIERLKERLTILYISIKGAAATLIVTGACMLSAPDATAQQNFEAIQTNPFSLSNIGYYYSSPAYADLDGDGDLDMISGSYYGNFYYYENTGDALNPSFDAPQENPFSLSNVGTYSSDPSFVDLDGDGDLDIMSADYDGNFKYFENTGTALAPSFAAASTNPFSLGYVAGYGSKSTFADIDGDGDFDMISGSNDGNLYYFENTGTSLVPSFAAASVNPFSLTQLGIEYGYLSSPEFVDLDLDGDLDLMVGNGIRSFVYFENIGTPLAPSFATLDENPFSLTSINLGGPSTPSFADLDGDGDMDLSAGGYSGDFFYFENTSSPLSNSRYETVVENPFSLSDIGSFSFPSFGDLDGDGDLDMIAGNVDGVFNYFENIGTSLVASFSLDNSFVPADLGVESTAALIDLDGDGDLDLLSGDYNGDFYYFENTGTALSPSFAASSKNNFGLTNIGQYNSNVAFADLDGDGDQDLMSGSFDANFIYFENTGTRLVPSFATLLTNPFSLNDIGDVSSVTFTDWDSDGDLDLMAGDKTGVFIYFENIGTPLSPSFDTPQSSPFGLTDIGLYSRPTFADLDGDGDMDLVAGEDEGSFHYFESFNTGANGSITAADIQSGESIVVSVTDSDLDTDALLAETVDVSVVNTTSNETETVTLTETGDNTGIFTGSLATEFGTIAGTDEDAILVVQAGDVVQLTYSDENNDSRFVAQRTSDANVNSIVNTWTGGTSNVWSLASNWSLAEVPNESHNVIIADVTNDPITSELDDIAVFDLTVDAGATLTLDANDNESSITINGNLINNGQVTVSNGASLITNGSITGTNFMINRVTTFNQSTGKYSIVGSPIEDANFSSLGSNSIVYGYDPTELYNQGVNDGLDRFKTPSELGQTEMGVGQGYFSAFTGDGNGEVTFTGKPNTGDISIPLTFTNLTGTGEDTFEGFHLVSNPYPSSIHFETWYNAQFTDFINGSIYLWDDDNTAGNRGTNGDYIAVNLLGNTDSNNGGLSKWDGYIRSAQGFFVQIETSLSIKFNNEMRVVGNSDSGGYYRTAKRSAIKLSLSNGVSQSAMVVGFADDATIAIDKKYDAIMMGGVSSKIYSLINELPYAIQGLPAQFAEVVSIGFETELSGEHILSVTDFSINGDVYLIDHQTGNQVLLTESSTYMFTSEAGVFNDRFQLSFGYESIVSGLDDENNGIYSYSKNWITHVVLKDKTIDQANFRLLDLNGKVVRASFGKVTNSQWMVNTSGLKAGVYIVSVEAKGGVWKQKMVVN